MSEQHGRGLTGGGPAYPSAHPRFDDDKPAAAHAEAAQEIDELITPEPTAAHDDGGRRDVGLVFMGASMTAGYGDPKALGWTGRVIARTNLGEGDLTSYNLGIRGNTSGDVLARWRGECALRWAERRERRLVVSVGAADVATGLSMARSRLNLANVLDEAKNSGIGVFVVGVTPGLEADENLKLGALSEAQADVCARRGVPYVDCYRPLIGHEQWLADLAAGPDRKHPGQAGYGLIAWLVLHNGWQEWLAQRTA